MAGRSGSRVTGSWFRQLFLGTGCRSVTPCYPANPDRDDAAWSSDHSCDNCHCRCDGNCAICSILLLNQLALISKPPLGHKDCTASQLPLAGIVTAGWKGQLVRVWALWVRPLDSAQQPDGPLLADAEVVTKTTAAAVHPLPGPSAWLTVTAAAPEHQHSTMKDPTCSTGRQRGTGTSLRLRLKCCSKNPITGSDLAAQALIWPWPTCSEPELDSSRPCHWSLAGRVPQAPCPWPLGGRRVSACNRVPVANAARELWVAVLNLSMSCQCCWSKQMLHGLVCKGSG